MERDRSIAEKHIDLSSRQNNRQDARKSLNNYINQLKIHFDLNDEDIIEIVKTIFDNQLQRNDFSKKWWQIWK